MGWFGWQRDDSRPGNPSVLFARTTTRHFEPTVIKGKPGQRLTLTIKNSSSTEHNFTVKSQHVDKDLEGGKTETVTVTLPSSGTISFFCEYHRTSGMAGGLQSS